MSVDMLSAKSMPVNMFMVKSASVADPSCCPPILGPDLGEEDAERAAAVIRALGDPNRLRLISVISEAGEACVCNLTQPLALSQSTVSHHLRVLTEAGLLERDQRGKWAYYRVRIGALEVVRELGEGVRLLLDGVLPARSRVG